MQEMVKNPDKWLRESKRLAEEGGIDNYEATAEILHDLRKAVGATKGTRLLVSRRQAWRRRTRHSII
jgi:hypothetical protein